MLLFLEHTLMIELILKDKPWSTLTLILPGLCSEWIPFPIKNRQAKIDLSTKLEILET